VTRKESKKTINQSESIRGKEGDSGASLKFIILGVARMRNLKIIKQDTLRKLKNPIKQII